MNLHMDHMVKDRTIDLVDSILLFIAILVFLAVLGTAFIAVA
jgi:hypothetical protein